MSKNIDTRLCRQPVHICRKCSINHNDVTILSMHLIVQEINKKLELIEKNSSYVDLIDENGNILIQHDETFPNLAQGFLLKAKRKRLRTLKDIAAYNVAKYTESTSDVKVLTIPLCLHNLVSIFLDTYSGDYLSV